MAEVDDGRLVSVRGDVDHPVSHGYICPKGHGLPWSQNRPDRLDYPMIAGRRVTWEELLDDLAARMQTLVERYSGSCVGRYEGTGSASDMLGKRALVALLKGLGSTQFYSAATIDAAPSFRIAQMVAGTFRLQPQWLPEDSESRLSIWMGSNPAVSHAYISALPDPMRRIKSFRKRGGQLWVVDPRATKTVSVADRHLAIRPGTDYVLLAWLLGEVIKADRLSEAFVRSTTDSQRARLSAALAPYTLEYATDETQLAQEDLVAFRSEIFRCGRISIVTATGVNFQRHALITEWLRWALLLATDSLDKPGGMWFSPGWFEAYDLLERPLPPFVEALARPESRPDLPRLADGIPVVAMPDEIRAGHLRALIVNGGNPMSAFPDPLRTREVLGELDLLVVADVVPTATTKIASHILPVTGQMERMDCLAHYVPTYAAVAPAVVSPGGERRPMWWICAQLASRLGIEVLNGADPDTVTESELWASDLESARSDLGDLLAAGSHGIKVPEVWDYLPGRVLPGGSWNIMPDVLLDRFAGMMAGPEMRSPFVFINARQLTRNCSSKFVPADKSRDRPTACINPVDADALGIEDGDLVRIIGEDGELTIAIHADRGVGQGLVCMTQGWTEYNVSALCSQSRYVDPLTGQPAMTALHVRLEPIKAQALEPIKAQAIAT